MFRVGRIWIVAQPVESVAVSGAPYTQPYGSPSTYTSAPEMEKPRVSETCTRIASGPLREATRLGEKRTPSTTSRAGGATLEIGIDVLPPASLI